MKRRTKRLLAITSASAAFLVVAFFLRIFGASLFTNFFSDIPKNFQAVKPTDLSSEFIESATGSYALIEDSLLASTISREALLSSPLIILDRAVAAPFSPQNVVDETNRMRSEAGLDSLKSNELLAKSAAYKVQDMFERQYFEHVSPAGDGPDGFVKEVGYDYAYIGENLALGNFGDEGALVEAWMKSPGHRANILRKGFTEIGVAVGRGNIEGRQVLLVVQHFARPTNSCPRIDFEIKNTIETLRAEIRPLGAELDAERLAIERSETATTSEQDHKARVDAYNARVIEYNQKVAQIKKLTDTYNTEIRNFNTCLTNSAESL